LGTLPTDLTEDRAMTEITYRPMSPADHEDVKGLIDQAFHVERYARTQHVRDSVLEVYMRDCLAGSTYSRVAVMGGHVVGLILVRAAGRPRLPGTLLHRVTRWAHVAKIAVTGLSDLPSIAQYRVFDRSYRELRAEVGTGLDNEITLFAVSAEVRGRGVGGHLFEEAVGYLRSHGARTVFLYTDTECSYGFYDNWGLTRAATRDITVTLGGRPYGLRVFLFAGRVDQLARPSRLRCPDGGRSLAVHRWAS
jgi:predicted N-acetyltransferase YhbS